MEGLLTLPIIDSPAMWIVYGVAAVLLVTLLCRRPTAKRVRRALIGILVGAAVGAAAYLVSNVVDAFGVDLPVEVGVWAAAAFAGVGLAIVSLWDSHVWRKIVAALSIVWFVVTAVIGINAFYGLNPNVGTLFGVVASAPIGLPALIDDRDAPAQPIHTTWTPPGDMPEVGQRGTQAIPGTVSGFVARDASVYLPPAALVKDPPALPVVIMMMGYTGNPDGTIISNVLDGFAAKHDGLAPIVIVADQLGGDGSRDPACADSPTFGNAETYVTTDVVNWARANLNVIDDPDYWTIAGYSNGGGCAAKYAAKYPQTFQNVIDVSGEEFPGSEDPDAVVTDVYGGDEAAFEASKPINIMKAAPAGTYRGMTGIFSAGSEDPSFLAAARAVSTEAQTVGMDVTLFEVDGADHGGTAVSGGLDKGFEVLFPVLGLSSG